LFKNTILGFATFLSSASQQRAFYIPGDEAQTTAQLLTVDILQRLLLHRGAAYQELPEWSTRSLVKAHTAYMFEI
jgi:hypothetical protein